MRKKFILSIDAAVGNGSLTLFEKRVSAFEFRIADTIVMNEKSPSSQSILKNISELFEKNEVNKTSLETILITETPAVSTGIRIGLATALGLRKGTGAELILLNILDVLSFCSTLKYGKIITAMPLRTRNVFWKIYEIKEGQIKTGKESGLTDKFSFINALENIEFEQIILTDDVLPDESESYRDKLMMISKNANISKLIGKYYFNRVR